MALNRNLKAVIRQGICEVMEPHIGTDGIDKDDWTRDLGEWLESTHPDYNVQLMMIARDTVLRQLINEYIRSTRHRDPNEALDILGIRHEIELNNRIVQIRLADGNFRAKKIGDVTLNEIKNVMDYYKNLGASMAAAYTYYAAIHQEMTAQGFGPDARVSQLLRAA